VLALLALFTWERILLPVVTRGPINGANGSRWEAVVTVHNNGDVPLTMYKANCATFPPGASKFCAQAPFLELAPHTTQRIEPNGYPAFVLNVSPDAQNLLVETRIRDLSREADSFGTEIPAIRVPQMKTGKGAILDIPHDPRFRLMLRVYGDWNGGGDLVMRFVNETTGRSRDERFPIKAGDGLNPLDDGDPAAAPALYGTIADFDAWPEMQDAARMRIELSTTNESARYWAFVSVTNNETQQVTILTVK
jgi:hypothetical protein